MPICPNGHPSSQDDFCDLCGTPITVAQLPAESKTVVCPNCQTRNVPQALFCESCGYDFMTGTAPADPWAAPPPTGSAQADAAAFAEALSSYQNDPNSSIGSLDAWLSADSDTNDSQTEDPASQVPELVSELAVADQPIEVEVTVPETDEFFDEQVAAEPVEWVAELWIDPDWYELQGATDPLPSPGLPDIIPLVKKQSLIGRASTSKQIFPDIDCDLDNGCSRRHAQLITDGSRWWIEDLDSANGTFIGPTNGPLPSMPIPHGKVELRPDQRIYLGAWSRIVIRRATKDEQEAFAD